MSKIISDSGSDQYILTPEGGRLLYNNPVCSNLIKDIVNNDEESLSDLFGQQENLQLAYKSQYSSVWRLDGDNLAVKLTNVTKNRQSNLRQGVYENPMGQMAFALWLNRELGRSLPEANITVPKQYLALRTKTGESIHIRQWMDGWKRPAANAYDSVLERLRLAALRLGGLSNLGLNGLGFKPDVSFISNNVLIEEGWNDPDEAKLCIIDRPGPGLVGQAVVRAVFHALKFQSDLHELVTDKPTVTMSMNIQKVMP